MDFNCAPDYSLSGLSYLRARIEMVCPSKARPESGITLRDQYASGGTQIEIKQDRRILILVNGKRINANQTSNHTATLHENFAVPVAVRLDQIKDRLALSVTQLAELFGVTRKSVYDWYVGAEPRPSTMSRIEILADVLNETSQEIDVSRIKNVWSIELSGKSFRSIFNDDSIESEEVRSALISKLHELSSRMVSSTSSSIKSPSRNGEAHLFGFERSGDRA